LNDSGIETPLKRIFDDRPESRKRIHSTDDTPESFIRDNVHGLIGVPALCMRIIDTPEFERLRSIKQLGMTHYVYPAGRHSRFEHCLGVMHLAGQMVKHLQFQSPGCCSATDLLCVMVAGLCHDVGHGPFSHLWEQFLAEARQQNPSVVAWKHEQSSVDIIERIFENIEHSLSHRDIDFIKELVGGPLGEDSCWPYLGRGKEHAFLYEIVANELTGVDVDKMDYIVRDSRALMIGSTFQVNRYIYGCRVHYGHDGRSQIVVNDKVLGDVCDLYLDRARLHRNAYQHKTVKVLDRMLIDVLLAADNSLDIVNSQERVRLTEVHEKLDHFLQLSDDYVFRSIQIKGSLKSRHILERILRRNFYKIIYEQEFLDFPMTRVECEKEIKDLSKKMGSHLDTSHLSVICRSIDYGKKGGSNMKNVVFFKKQMNGNILFHNPESMQQRIPAYLNCVTLLVVCTSLEEDIIQESTRVVEAWGNQLQKGGTNQLVKAEQLY